MHKFYLPVIWLVIIHLELASLHPYWSSRNLVSKPENLKMVTFKMPANCKDTKKMNYCFSKENYPADIVKELVANFTALKFKHADDDSSGHFSQRDSSCGDVNEHFIYYVVDKHGRDRVVVQVEGKFTQKFTVRTCRPEDNPSKLLCFYASYLSKKHNLTCTESKLNYSFLVLQYKPDFEGKFGLETISTEIPVCCSCRHDNKY